MSDPETVNREADEPRHVLALWQKSIDAQLELARMASRSRQLGLVLAAVGMTIGVTLVGLGDAAAIHLALGGRDVAVSSGILVLLVAVGSVLLLRMLDLDIHERMLRGAFAFAGELEDKHLKAGLARGMSRSLEAATAADRPRRFYGYAATLPAVTAVVLLILTNTGRGPAAAAPTTTAAVIEEEVPLADPVEPTPELTPELTPTPEPATVIPATTTTPAPAIKPAAGKPALATATKPAEPAKPAAKTAAGGEAAAAPKAEPTPAAKVDPPPAPKAEPPADPKPDPKPEPKPEPPPAEPKPAEPPPATP